MATIKLDTMKGTANTDANPSLNGILRDIATDLAELNTGIGAVTAPTAPAALGSSQNATTGASDPTTTQALANALKTSYNALQTDVVALRTKIGELVTALSDVDAVGGVSILTVNA